jgi:hypothetical protein
MASKTLARRAIASLNVPAGPRDQWQFNYRNDFRWILSSATLLRRYPVVRELGDSYRRRSRRRINVRAPPLKTYSVQARISRS